MTTEEANREHGTPRLHGDLLSTSLLALLRAYNAYGYELGKRLAEAGLSNYDSGTIYRTLRQLDKAGFVSSFWDTSSSGPAKRMYSLTAAGSIFLEDWITLFQRYQQVLQGAMEAVAPDGVVGGGDQEAESREGEQR